MFFAVVHTHYAVCSKTVAFVLESQAAAKFVQECVRVVCGEPPALVLGVIHVIVKRFIFPHSATFELMGDVDIRGNRRGISIILIVDKGSLMIDLRSAYIG